MISQFFDGWKTLQSVGLAEVKGSFDLTWSTESKTGICHVNNVVGVMSKGLSDFQHLPLAELFGWDHGDLQIMVTNEEKSSLSRGLNISESCFSLSRPMCSIRPPISSPSSCTE
jgi:hypothetical protein